MCLLFSVYYLPQSPNLWHYKHMWTINLKSCKWIDIVNYTFESSRAFHAHQLNEDDDCL
jgi:hypothetical protein